jgi:16S rRNA processing protein RimM
VRGEDFKEAEISACRPVHAGFLVRFAGFESREAIAEAVGYEVHLPREKLGPLTDGEFYVEDIVGCDVFDMEGLSLGRVKGIFWNGAQDVMTIVADDGGERLLPVVAQFVRRFELLRRRLVVDFHD